MKVPFTEIHACLSFVFLQKIFNWNHAVPLFLTVNKCIAFQSREDEGCFISHNASNPSISFIILFPLDYVSLLSHLFFNILSLSAFMSSLSSIVTDTSTNPARSFMLLLFLLFVLQFMNISSIAFWNFHSLIHFYCYHISFLTSSPDFLF